MGYDLFVSYARRDNTEGRVSDLVARIRSAFRSFAGRDLRVFFDTREIHGMDDWRQAIQRSLRESHLFLAVLSPGYLASPYCRWEWDDYVRYEAMRQCLGEGVAPVFFVTLTAGAAPEPAIREWISDIEKRQAFDLRPWREAGEAALQQAHVRETLDALQASVSGRLERAERARRSPDNLMRHNPQFVGRVRELTDLRQTLVRNKLGIVGAGAAGRVAAVQGMGGIGKTELALAYAHAFAWDYPGGRWQLRCEGLADLRVALQQLAGPLRFDFSDEERRDPELSFERVLRAIARADRMLLVLDNVTDGRLFDPARLDRLPLDGTLDVLATTRLAPRQVPGSAQGFDFISVDALPEDDALALLRSHQPAGRFPDAGADDDARAIAVLLEGFTLAVETAAVYLGRHAGEIGAGQFLQDLRSRLLDRSEGAAADESVAVRHRETLLATTLAFTLDTLPAGATRVLRIAALLPADQIAVPWLQAIGGVPEPAFAGAIELLLGLRLLQSGQSPAEGRIVRMHRLVQEVVRRRDGAAGAALEEPLRAHVRERADALETAWVDATSQWEIPPLAAYARLALERDTPDASVIGSRAAARLYELAHFGDAEPLMRQVLARDERLRGARHADVAADLGNLGLLLATTNRRAEAEPLLRRALAIDEAIYDARHPAVALRLGNLAELLVASNRIDEAEGLARRVLAITSEAYDGADAGVAVALNNLARILGRTGRLGEAEALLRQALSIDRRLLGPAHPNVAIRLGNLAVTLAEAGRAAEAEAPAREALAINESALGADHPSVASDLNTLAGVLQALDRGAEAEPLIRRALAIDEKRYGPDHPAVASRLNMLAHVCGEGGRPREAEPLLRRALAIEEASLDPDDPLIGATLNNLGTTLVELERPHEAEPVLRRMLEILLRTAAATRQKPARIDDALRNYQAALAAMGLTGEQRRARLIEIMERFDLP